MLANLLTLNVLQQKTIGLPDSDGLQNPALGKAAIRCMKPLTNVTQKKK